MTKTYVVTGAASGIGRALTEKLSDNNVVFASYRKSEHADILKNISPNIFPFYLDYSNPDTIVAAANYIKNKCTHIDTLVNIAGCVVAGPIERISIAELRRQFDVNVFGHIELMQNLSDFLANGKIINISSMASFGNFPFISPYCASKRALDIFFNAYAVENKKNISVISIKPGVIATPLWNKSVEENSKYFDQFFDYKSEMEFVADNARRNQEKGLSVDNVVKVIIKADMSKNPKTSYTVGKDAYFAEKLACLPQKLINTLIKIRLKKIIDNK